MKSWQISSALIALAAISLRAQAPLPDGISIQPPSSTVTRQAAAFSGAWIGAWGHELPTALIVEQISSNGTANLIYSWGDSPMHQFKTGWNHEIGNISNSDLRLLTTVHKIDFTLKPNGTLLGRYWLASNRPPSFATLYRVSSTNSAEIRKAAARVSFPPWKENRIAVHSEVGPTKGKTFWLQTTVFPQRTPGKYPVVIINHGSTGPVLIPTNLVFRGGGDVDFFRSLGYVVVVPMRKGRGQSGGPDFEENRSVVPAVELDSAIEDLHAVVEYIRSEKDVDPDRILLVGASRGGLLSVAYAGRYPAHIIGVVNFSGGWISEDARPADFNFEAFRNAGRDAKVPMLWLYADHDSYYSLKFDEREFSAFRKAGGRGDLVEVRNIPGNGHELYFWLDRWQDKVNDYLNGL